MKVYCAKCVGSAVGTRLELYQALWRQRIDGEWECCTHAHKGDDARFLTFHHERNTP